MPFDAYSRNFYIESMPIFFLLKCRKDWFLAYIATGIHSFGKKHNMLRIVLLMKKVFAPMYIEWIARK